MKLLNIKFNLHSLLYIVFYMWNPEIQNYTLALDPPPPSHIIILDYTGQGWRNDN